MDLQTNIQNTTQYSGKANIKAYHNGALYENRELHNTGTADLCGYICDCLRGVNVIAQRPGYLIPCTWDNSSSSLVNMFSYGILYTGLSTTNKDATGASYSLSFLIPAIVLAGKNQIDGFRLYSTDENRTLYAEIDTHTDPIQLVQNSNLSIDWSLRIAF